MTATITASGDVKIKAGDNVSTDLVLEYDDQFIPEAEGVACSVSRYDWVTNWATISGNKAIGIVKETVDNLAAIYALEYKPSGQSGTLSRIEFEDRINILRDAALRGLAILRDQKVVKFLTG